MPGVEQTITVRPFSAGDAEFCFKIRSEAFVRVFYDEVGPVVAAAGVNAHMPGDYEWMAETMHCFIAEVANEPVGFCTVRIVDETTAELLFLYVELERVNTGIGSHLERYAEDWLAANYAGIKELIVDTIIPRYNRAFYEKIGFVYVEDRTYSYPGIKVRAVRLAKQIGTANDKKGDDNG